MDGARALPSLLRKAAAEEQERGRRSTEGGDRGDPSRIVLLRACAEAARGGTEGGCRATCLFLSVAETLDDSIVPLAKRWERTGAPALDPLVSSESPLRPIDEDLLRCAARMLKGVVVDDVEDHQRVAHLLDRFLPRYRDRLEYYDGADPLFRSTGIESRISAALERRVPLPSGGHIVIDMEQ